MAIKLKTKEGLEFSFDTVAEFMEFKKKMDEEEDSKELTSEPIEDTSDDEIEVPGTEPKFEAGDKVRVVSAEDGTETPYHHINIGSVVEVVSNQSRGGVEVVEDGVHQYLLPGHFEKVESLGKDANGEDLYAGDFVTGINADDYYFANSTVVMEVMGRGISITDEDANIQVRIIGEPNTYGVDSSKFVKLSDNLDEAKDKFDEINGEGESELLPVGTKIRMLRPSNCGDLLTGDVGTITDIDERCPMGLVYSVRVRSGEDGYGWAKREDAEVVEDEHEVPEKTHEFEVGDKVRVVGNNYGHWMGLGELREIKEVDPNEPKYNLSGSSCGYWAGTSDIEHVHSSPKFQTGDVVKVTESFSDILGLRAICGAVYNYDENLGLGEPSVGTVFLGDNIDKIELVCRAQDRLDKY